jgi:homogentisate 1,2-dioxygenase
VVNGPSRGYACDNYGAKFTLPNRGPIHWPSCSRRAFPTPDVLRRRTGKATGGLRFWARLERQLSVGR